ncbi:MAG: hypothetical protein ABI882_18005 [Acidobacteriota bacterium]
MKRPAIVLALLFLILIAPVRAATLSIEIRDLSNKPIPGVVIAYSYNGTPPAMSGGGSVTTDAEGKATLIHPGLGGSSCLLLSAITYSISKQGFQFTQTSGSLPCGPVSSDLSVTGTDLPKITSVSAASYEARLTGNMIAATFGTNLAAFTEFAVSGLETSLANRSVLIKDTRGIEKAAELLFVSPGQINYIVPGDLSEGIATIKLAASDGSAVGAEFAGIRNIAPGVFAANADGRGIAAALIVRVKPGNIQSYEPVATLDEALGRFVARPIDLGPASEVVYLTLFGTGWRNTASIATTTVVIGGITSELQYAGVQPTIAGLDQINVRLSRDLIGRGEVTVAVEVSGVFAKPVNINIK